MFKLRHTKNTRPVYINGKESNLYRSDKLNDCDDNDLDTLIDNNVLNIIDIRNLDNKTCHPALLKEPFNFKNFCLRKTREEYAEQVPDMDKSIPDYYVYLTGKLEPIYDFFNFILHSNGKFLVYCAIGRDRTGTLCMLAQMLCGCSNDEIAHEYALTDKIYENYDLGLNCQKWFSYDRSYQNALEFIKRFNAKYTDINSYFIKLGFDEAQIKLIKSKIICN